LDDFDVEMLDAATGTVDDTAAADDTAADDAEEALGDAAFLDDSANDDSNADAADQWPAEVEQAELESCAGSAADDADADESGAVDDDSSSESSSEADLLDAAAPAPAPADDAVWLEELTCGVGDTVKEGGPAHTRVRTEARNSAFYPFENATVQLLWTWQHKFQIPASALQQLFNIVWHGNTEGADATLGRFTPTDCPTKAVHFAARYRKYLPLLELVERECRLVGHCARTHMARCTVGHRCLQWSLCYLL
jgi:hypothetical protein